MTVEAVPRGGLAGRRVSLLGWELPVECWSTQPTSLYDLANAHGTAFDLATVTREMTHE